MQAYSSPQSRVSGPAIAAMYGVLLGLLVMAIANIATEASEGFEASVHTLGKIWIPGAEAMGAYSGKETVGLISWLVSWAILYYALRKRDLPLGFLGVAFLVGVAITSMLFWPPIIHLIIGG